MVVALSLMSVIQPDQMAMVDQSRSQQVIPMIQVETMVDRLQLLLDIPKVVRHPMMVEVLQ